MLMKNTCLKLAVHQKKLSTSYKQSRRMTDYLNTVYNKKVKFTEKRIDSEEFMKLNK